jgi:predicted nicotinamide N-methyase
MYLQGLLPGCFLQPQTLPLCPEISLYLINPDYPQQGLTTAAITRLMDEPPYWGFCWASGQVLARHILDHPHRVAGLHVTDFGSGSGVVAIAAAMAGAGRVSCIDIDPYARQAIVGNARLNGVELQVSESLSASDMVTAADVLYDRENLPLLAHLMAAAPRVLLADSRIRDLAFDGLRPLGEYQSSTWPDLDESAEFNRVRLYAAGAD